ncbi:hypothetical protein P409_17015, partial [Inquilinus limosus MP06]
VVLVAHRRVDQVPLVRADLVGAALLEGVAGGAGLRQGLALGRVALASSGAIGGIDGPACSAAAGALATALVSTL